MLWDIQLFYFFNSFAGRFAGLDQVGIFAALWLLPLLPVLLVLAAFTIKRLREERFYELLVKALVASGLAYVLRFILGWLIARPRPFAGLSNVQQLVSFTEKQDSFPSGHAALAFALAFFIFKHDRDWGVAFLVLATLIALGRVFVGVHYPLDVLGGALVGWISAGLVWWFEKQELKKLGHALRVR